MSWVEVCEEILVITINLYIL